MKPWQKKNTPAKPVIPPLKGKVCTCCVYGNHAGYVCVECETLEQLKSDLEERHRRHHEESAAIRDLYRDVLDNRPGQE